MEKSVVGSNKPLKPNEFIQYKPRVLDIILVWRFKNIYSSKTSETDCSKMDIDEDLARLVDEKEAEQMSNTR